MDLSALAAAAAAFELKLDNLYTQELSLTAQFVDLGRAIGAIGALLYISSKVWGHLARTEPIDVYPLLRPFAIGMAILLFPQLCQGLRGITLAISHGTDAVRLEQQAEIRTLTDQKDAAIKDHPGNEDFTSVEKYDAKIKELGGALGVNNLGQQTSLGFKRLQFETGKSFREWIKNILELGAMAAQLGISLLATFLLIMLSVAGPLAFGIAIIPGFGGGIQKWLGHFITISLWVPVANIYSSIIAHLHVDMLTNDIAQINANGSIESTDIGYLCFLVLSIVGYLYVPKATDMLIAASGTSGAATSFMAAATGAAGMAGAGAGMAGRSGASGVGSAATGLGAAVGFGQNLAGMAGSANRSGGEDMGHRAGSAVREWANRRKRE